MNHTQDINDLIYTKSLTFACVMLLLSIPNMAIEYEFKIWKNGLISVNKINREGACTRSIMDFKKKALDIVMTDRHYKMIDWMFNICSIYNNVSGTEQFFDGIISKIFVDIENLLMDNSLPDICLDCKNIRSVEVEYVDVNTGVPIGTGTGTGTGTSTSTVDNSTSTEYLTCPHCEKYIEHIDQLENELDKEKEKYDIINTVCNEYLSRIKSLEDGICSTNELCCEMKNDYDNMALEHQCVVNDLTKMYNENVSYENALSTLKSMIQDADTSNTVLNERNIELEINLSTLKTVNHEIQTSYESLVNQNACFMETIKMLESRIDISNKRYDEIMIINNKSNGEMKDMEKKISNMRRLINVMAIIMIILFII